MKSIQNQYIALKEGRMSQANFMRNVRMSLPQYISNVNSFEDTVRILKNKNILTETNISELSPQTKYDAAMKAVDKSWETNNPSASDRRKSISQGNKFVQQIDPILKKTVEDFGKSLGLETSIEKGADGYKFEPVIQILMGKDLRVPEVKITIRKDSDEIEGYLPDEAAERRLGNLIKQIQQKELNVELKDDSLTEEYYGSEDQSGIDRTNMFNDAVQNSISRLDVSEYPGIEKFVNDMDIDVFDDVIAMDPDDAVAEFIRMFEDHQIEQQYDAQKDSPEMYKFQDFPNGISEAKKKKAKKEEKPYNPNAIHPSELRMGIKVEMEHTDDPKKAEKIALDHLAENPYYYTALKLSGIESPSAPKAKAPVAAKKVKKKDATEMIDTANQMQKVKLMKESLEKLVREAIKEMQINGEGFEQWKQALYNIVMKNANLEADEIAIDDTEIKKYYQEGKTPKEVYFDIWLQDAGNFRNIPMEESLKKLVREVIKEMQGGVGEFSPVGQDSAAYRAKRTTLMNIDELRMEPMWMGQELAKVLPADYTDADLENAINAYLEHFNVPYFKETGFKLKVGTTFYKELKDTIAFHQKPLPTDQKGFNYGSTSHYGGSSW